MAEDEDFREEISELASRYITLTKAGLWPGPAWHARLATVGDRIGLARAEALLKEEMAGKAKAEADAIAAAKGYSPLAVVRQQPVGHGGFHTGALGIDKPLVRWVYDCGAWREAGKLALAAGIRDLARKVRRSSRVDLLFLSHFDADHVSGVGDLLRRVRVQTLILPYLEPEEAFGVIAEAAATGASKRQVESLAQAALRPGEWFGPLGVIRVVRLRPGPGREPEGALATAPPPPDGPARFSVSLTDRLGAPLPDAGLVDAESGLSARIVTRSGMAIDWMFRPFVHPVSDGARGRLRDAAKDLIGVAVDSPEFGDRLIAFVKDKGLKPLRALYVERELADANGKSLSLYLGPEIGALRRPLGDRQNDRHETGWLLTGDAKLRNADRRAAWLAHYAAQGRLTGFLMVPHHGAAGNFHPEVVELAPYARLFVTAREGDPLRPHEDVVADMREAGDGRPILRVSELADSEIVAVSGAADYRDDPLVKDRGCLKWT